LKFKANAEKTAKKFQGGGATFYGTRYSREKDLSNRNVFNCLLNTVSEGAAVLEGCYIMSVPPSHGMNGHEQRMRSLQDAFAAQSVVGDSRNVVVVALLPRRSSTDHGKVYGLRRRHVVTTAEDNHGQSEM